MEPTITRTLGRNTLFRRLTLAAVGDMSNITGAIYSPSAVFKITGTMQAGQSSGWTVIAAKSLEVVQNPTIVINADYTGFVPVPSGVGNKAGITHMKQ